MPSGGAVPSFDEFEARGASIGLGLELSPVAQFAFERGEEALAHALPGRRLRSNLPRGALS